uniref:Uncharacterized protein n=1 Tax=Timema cristinae TaxID=61476 RepID=A0A7R9C8L6_TIMCR|nr:unnamed protein product [Timema cristinae]
MVGMDPELDADPHAPAWLQPLNKVLLLILKIDDLDVSKKSGRYTVQSREGFTNLTGVDYSETAISLAKAVADAQQNATIKYEVCDILAEDSENVSPLLLSCYAVALDKGTYDAISLHPENAKEKRVKSLEVVRRGRRKLSDLHLEAAYINGPLPISAEKRNDLLELCRTGIIPLQYHPFYEALKTAEDFMDNDTESD